ncbi:MAG: Mrp/NBP35 family ATP-binding protein [Oscillospiraceae bacterium]|jgi:Mrp family chromosome partitioning ATPase|nr:Mrp/NBP35 family ATP-binding protein [Oscillospiraceae bacterium]
MSEENCNHDCSSCGEDCPSRKSPADLIEKPNPLSHVGKVIGVVSGKGGVGKSLVTSLLAVLLNRRGLHTGVLDADVTGPSIPKVFGVHGKVQGNDHGIFPAKTKTGIDIISVNLLLDDESAPVVWRGPLIGNIVKQFWTDVIWDKVDCLFVDMPPGTGDVPLTVFQSVPVDGIVVVTSPQELVSLIVSKAVNMAKMMNIPIVGIVENMSYVKCPDCGKEIKVFGESHLDETAEKYGLNILGRLPIDPDAARKCDAGLVEEIEAPWLKQAADAVQNLKRKDFK